MLANRNLVILAIAAIIGIVAVILANSYLSGIESNQEKTVENNRLVQIAVARVPMDYGVSLTTENVRMISWPEASVPAGAFRSAKELIHGAEPRVVLRPIEAGEPILPGKITGFGGRASLSELIETDMRAVAVRINDVAGVAGFVLPGDRVDVLLTRQPRLDGQIGEVDQITDVLLQNVRVLAIDQEPAENKTEPRVGKTVTLSVDQQSAQKLALAGTIGQLSLALRNAANQDDFASNTVGSRDLGPADVSNSIYSGAGKSRESTVASSPFPFPFDMTRGMPVATPRRADTPAPRPRPVNSVPVEIVRGTSSSVYDVRRHRGY